MPDDTLLMALNRASSALSVATARAGSTPYAGLVGGLLDMVINVEEFILSDWPASVDEEQSDGPVQP